MNNQPLEALIDVLSHSADIIHKPIQILGHPGVLIYIPTITDSIAIHEYILSPLQAEAGKDWDDFAARLAAGTAFSLPYTETLSHTEAADHVVFGKPVLFIEGNPAFYCFEEATQYQKRAVTESQSEVVIIGPQEAFIENIGTNLALLRHKLKHPDLKVRQLVIGEYTKSITCIVYVEGLASQDLIEQTERKLASISAKGVFGASYLSESLNTSFTLFPLFQFTERPDAVAASLLEGRIAIMVEGTPSVMMAPMSMISLLQSSEDYYQNYYAASWIRLVRFSFALIALLMPSLYIAITTFHPQIIPSNLLITIASARENIPFSALAEAFVMELTFEALREAGTRIPKPVGQTVSIIGGIVIGQAAVQAGIVSAPMVIVVSITGIASFIIPHIQLGLVLRLLRFPLMILGGTMGLIGVFAGTFLIYAHVVSLKSFNTPYMEPLAPLIISEWKDTFFRFPFPTRATENLPFNPKRNPKGAGK